MNPLKRYGLYILDSFIHFIYPPICVICDGELSDLEKVVCSKCWDRINIIYEPYCLKCAIPIIGSIKSANKDELSICPQCASQKHFFSRARSLSVYEGVIEEIIHQLKYYKKKSIGIRLGKMLGEKINNDDLCSDIDYIIPVPLHSARKRERGYNQSEVISIGISQEIGKPVLTNVLHRKKYTRSLAKSGLNIEERRKEVSGAFVIKSPEKILGKKIAIVDDVFTTGATLDSCAKVLRLAGAIDVYALTVARATKW